MELNLDSADLEKLREYGFVLIDPSKESVLSLGVLQYVYADLPC